MFRLLAILLCGAVALPAADDLDKQIKTFVDAFAIVEANAAEPISSEQAFYTGAIPGMLHQLDPHSVFFDPGQFDQLQKMESSTQKGFGTVVSIVPGRVIVLQTLPGTASAKAGLMPGDEIMAINNYVIGRLDVDQLTELLGESRQHPAQLDVMRPGAGRIMRLVLTPEEMQTSSVERAFFIGPGIGYLHVTSFDENTGKDIKAAIEKLGGQKLNGLVLDKAEKAPESAKPYRFKLVVLVNEKTASASEIVSGALQDHDRATIVGEPTYGKGLVQSVYPLSGGAGLALTTALYYTPSGRSIQKPLDVKEFELGATTAHPNAQSEFHTDKGRAVTGGGGIRPDFVVTPEPLSRLRAALMGSGSFTGFATEYLRSHKVDEDFDVTPSLLDEFEAYAAALGIQPGPGEWATQGAFLRNHIKTEIFNQAFGVERGDQVELQRDPPVLKALEILGS